MEPGRLEAAVGRGARVTRTPARHRRRSGRPGCVVAAVLLLVLGAAWLAAPRRSAGSSAAPGARPEGLVAHAGTSLLRTRLGNPRTCHDVDASVPEVLCAIDGVRVDARLLPLATALEHYRTEAGANIAARAGAPACAKGRHDERAWSRPEAPSAVAGRYRCRRELGRAAIWWTDERGLLAHAVAADGNLAALFAWWRAQSGE